MKKNIILGLALATAGIAGVAVAQAPAAGADPLGGKTVTRAEAGTRAADMFAKLDLNRDGKLDQADKAARHGQMFDKLDTDKNGAVSRAEFAAAHQARAGDGEAPRDGWKGKRGGRGGKGGGMMLRMADANKDGAVSREEFLGAHARMFDAADANKDGSLTAAERKAHHAKMRQEMGGKRGHRGHGDMPPPPPAN